MLSARSRLTPIALIAAAILALVEPLAAPAFAQPPRPPGPAGGPGSNWQPDCARLYVPSASINIPNKYAAGRSQDQLSASNAAAYEAARGPLNDARDRINKISQRLLTAPDNSNIERQVLAACLMSNLAAMAEARALTGDLTSQARDLRMFLLPTYAIGYIAARAEVRNPSQEALIEAWLSTMTKDGMLRESARILVGNSTLHPHMINNHYYWTGLDALLVGVATEDSATFDWGRRAILKGLDEVDPDGFLEPELARESRALSYHAFALQPLAMGSLILSVNGRPPSSAQLEAAARLGNRTMAGLVEPRAFAAAVARRSDGVDAIAQVEVPRTPPAIPLLMMLTGDTPEIDAMDARVRCYPNGSLGPGPGVWTGRSLQLLRGPWARPARPLRPITPAFKLCPL